MSDTMTAQLIRIFQRGYPAQSLDCKPKMISYVLVGHRQIERTRFLQPHGQVNQECCHAAFGKPAQQK
jgi:hypothetical protein